jgi:hypothetical protein
MVAILHTWGSNLSLHPHLHCMVPAVDWMSKAGGRIVNPMAIIYLTVL